MGLVGLTNVLAQEGAAHNIKVNAIAPVAATRMTESRVARVFLGVTPGYFDSELTPESVAAHLDQIRAENGYAVPSSVLDEIRTVMSQLNEHDGP